MALETLKGVKEIGGFAVAELNGFADKRPEEFIVVQHENNGLSFKIQNGPIKDSGLNGCQVETIIEAAKLIIEGLNQRFPCRENDMTLVCLGNALTWQETRRENRIKRGVEGENKA